MKTKLLLLPALLLCLNVYSQFGPQQIINDYVPGASLVRTADFDGDGDMDVLAGSSSVDNKIAWYENVDGQGTFGPEQIITTDLNNLLSVFIADLDGDGDMDVLSASSLDGKIAWYENLDGQGGFGPQIVIVSEFGASSICASDLDNDGDMDLISGSNDGDATMIAWYENNGQGVFGPQQIIPMDIDYVFSVFSADMDGDGDEDLLSTSWIPGKIAWYENLDGNGSFGPQLLISDTLSPRFVQATDIDGDGDLDVVSVSGFDDNITWYENTDGLGNFGPVKFVTEYVSFPKSVYTADLDDDGDMDVLSTALGSSSDIMVWYENTDGQGSFGPQQNLSILFGATSVYAADLDNDGDMDLLSTSNGDAKIAWYENLGATNINENIAVNFSVYPVPSREELTVDTETRIGQIEIYDNLGQLVLMESNNLFQGDARIILDISKLKQGLYFIKVIDTKENFGVKKVLKN